MDEIVLVMIKMKHDEQNMKKRPKQDAMPRSRFQWIFDWWPLLAVVILIFGALAWYAYLFVSPNFPECTDRWDEKQCLIQSLADAKSSWGQLGDYMGGLINPIIGLLTIVLLVRSLRQNEEALKLTREEIERGIEVQKEAALVQEATKEALKAELAIAKASANRAELESMIVAFEAELSELAQKKFKEGFTWGSQTAYSLEDLLDKKISRLSLNLNLNKSVRESSYEPIFAIYKQCRAVIDLLIEATQDLMPYLNAKSAKMYYEVRAIKSIVRMYDLGVLNEEERQAFVMSVKIPEKPEQTK